MGDLGGGEESDTALLQRVVELLLAGGYFRARIPSLAPFDKLIGGLAWSITACNVEVRWISNRDALTWM